MDAQRALREPKRPAAPLLHGCVNLLARNRSGENRRVLVNLKPNFVNLNVRRHG
jgi:hypothetical protein